MQNIDITLYEFRLIPCITACKINLPLKNGITPLFFKRENLICSICYPKSMAVVKGLFGK